jgi:hypothetical protein
MKCSEYLTHVDETKFVRGGFGKWVKFSDSFPPVSDKEYDGIIIETLFEGNPSFHSVFMTQDGDVAFLDYDFNNEFFEYGGWSYLNLYWRFVPEPPGNEGYDCG